MLLAVPALGGPRERGALATLLWEDSAHARSNLRVELYRMARGPFAGALTTTGMHVDIADGVVCDMGRARHLAAAGDAAGALSAAGPDVLPWVVDVTGGLGEWLQAVRTDWTAFYRSALRDAAQHAERAGDHAGARAFIRQWSELDPLSEDARQEWLRLCVLLNDAPEARRVYAECDAMTRREFRRAPLVTTRAWLEQLGQLEAGVARGVTLPRLPLVGRAEVMRALQGGPVCTLLLGDPGVGKTRVALEFAKLADRAVVVSGAVAAGPLSAVMFTLTDTDAGALSGRSKDAIASLQGTSSVQMYSEAGRAALHDALAGALVESAGAHGCVVLDDLHAVDPASLDVLGLMLRQVAALARGRRPRVVATARAFELRGSAADAWVRSQRAAGTLRTLDVPPLSSTDLLALVQHLSTSPGGAQFAAALQKTTGGNPLFFLETLRALIGSGHIRVDEGGRWHVDFHAAGGYAHLPLPRSVQDAIVDRADLLDRSVRRVLDTLSVQARPLSVHVLAQACGLGEWEVMDAVQALEAAGFVHEVSAGVALRHDLQREALRHAVPEQRRRGLHATVANALAAVGTAPQEVAQCFESGGRLQDAARWWVRAGDHSRRAFALAEAAQSYGHALTLGLDDAAAFDAALSLFGVHLHALGDVERARSTLPALRSRQHAAALGPPQYALCEAHIHLFDAAYADVLAVTEQVLGTDLPDALRSTALYLRGSARLKLGQLAASEADLQASRELNPLSGSGRAFQVTMTLAHLASARGDHHLARQEGERLRRLAQVMGDPTSLTQADAVAGAQQAMAGEFPAARDLLRRAVELADRHGLMLLGAQARANLGGVLIEIGEYAEAGATLASALPHIPEQGRPTVLGNLSVSRFMTGDVGPGLAGYSEVVALARTRGEALLVLRRRAILLTMQVRCGAVVDDGDVLAMRGEAAALGSRDVDHMLQCVAIQSALLRGQDASDAARTLAALTPDPDELERHAFTLAWNALRRGDACGVAQYTAGMPASARISAVRLLARLEDVDPGRDARAPAVDALVLAHARALRNHADASAEVAALQQALEASWPEHGGAFSRLRASLLFPERVRAP